jgi:hypothetical protein
MSFVPASSQSGESRPQGLYRNKAEGERRRLMPSAFSLQATLAMVLSAAVVAAIAVLVTLSNLPSGWPQLIPIELPTEHGPIKFCIPFLTCKRAPPPPPKTGPVKGNVTLTRINYDELIRIVKPHLPSFNKNGVAGFRSAPPPKGLPIVRNPKLHLYKDPYAETFLKVLGYQKQALFARMQIDPADRRAWPYTTMGKLLIHNGDLEGSCSGTMIGDNLVLTADHCLPWGSPAPDWTTIEFVPAFDAADNPDPAFSRPFGTATVVQCAGINPPTNDGRDIAVCQLNWPIGEKSGKMMYRWPQDDVSAKAFYMDGNWYSVGYPYTFMDGVSPTMQDDITINEVDAKVDGGMLLSSAPYVEHGWSGGPLFGWDGYDPFIAGVVTAMVGFANSTDPPDVGTAEGAPQQRSFFEYMFADTTLHAGGERMAALATFGLITYNVTEVDLSPI